MSKFLKTALVAGAAVAAVSAVATAKADKTIQDIKEDAKRQVGRTVKKGHVTVVEKSVTSGISTLSDVAGALVNIAEAQVVKVSDKALEKAKATKKEIKAIPAEDRTDEQKVALQKAKATIARARKVSEKSETIATTARGKIVTGTNASREAVKNTAKNVRSKI